MVENTDNLDLKQVQVMDIIVEDGKCVGITTELDEEYRAKAVILCTGTYLDSMIIIGDTMYSGGPNGMRSSVGLSANLKSTAWKSFVSRRGRPPVWTDGVFIWRGWNWKRVTRRIMPFPL